jgi:hypothetical protein
MLCILLRTQYFFHHLTQLPNMKSAQRSTRTFSSSKEIYKADLAKMGKAYKNPVRLFKLIAKNKPGFLAIQLAMFLLIAAALLVPMNGTLQIVNLVSILTLAGCLVVMTGSKEWSAPVAQ